MSNYSRQTTPDAPAVKFLNYSLVVDPDTKKSVFEPTLRDVVLSATDPRGLTYKYSDSVSPKVKIVLGEAREKNFNHFSPLEEITVTLLPEQVEIDPANLSLPFYVVSAHVEDVLVRELFDPSKESYLPKKILEHPTANLIAITHGNRWAPEVEKVIMSRLKEAGISYETDIHHLFGHVISTDGILLKHNGSR
ncbi:hypothetical protein HYS31_08155 [Candidatus Woesearchaeota archaeon]|nr:hypothetical protein [Candidatus Woesearchaeota archaeon]